MVLRDLISDVFRTIWAHKLRTALTMFGIAWGVVSIVLMVAAGEGLRVGQAKVASTLGKDVMIVFSGTTSMQAGGTRAGREIQYMNTDHVVLQTEATDCQNALPELETRDVRIHSAFNAASVIVTGSLPPFADVRSLGIGSGRFYNWDDEKQARRVAFLGTEMKKQLFPGRDPVGETIYLNDVPFQVIGVMKAKDQDSSYDGFDVNKVFVPFSVMVRDFPNKPPKLKDSIDHLLVTPKSVAQHEACKGEVRHILGRLHSFDPTDKEACPIWDTVEEAKAFATMTDGMKYFLGAVGLTTLFLGGIGVMNVMLVAVRERTREIGVRKAVGAKSNEILRQFFVEALVVVLLSGGGGLALAFAFCWLVNLIPMPPFFAGLLPTWQSGALAVLLLGVVAVFSAVYPARRAASVDPIEALRFEAGG